MKGFTLLEALFAMLIAAAGVAAAMEIHSITLKNRIRAELSLLAYNKIESLMEIDRGRLVSLMQSGAQSPVENIFEHTQSSPLSCSNASTAECDEFEGGVTVCRIPESTSGVVKIQYVACMGEDSFREEQFIYVPKK